MEIYSSIAKFEDKNRDREGQWQCRSHSLFKKLMKIEKTFNFNLILTSNSNYRSNCLTILSNSAKQMQIK